MLLRSLAAVGLGGDGYRSAAELIASLADRADHSFDAGESLYRVCRWEGGGEVWLHVGAEGSSRAGRIVCATPFQSGKGQLRLQVRDVLHLDPTNPLNGGILARWQSQHAGDQPLELVLELLPFLPERLPALPFEARFEVMGLVSEMTVYPSAAGFLSRVPSSKLMSPGGVAPLASGIAADSDRPPSGDLRCVALLAGSIQEVRRLVNPISGQSYYAMTIATDRGLVNLACNVDAVAGPVPTLGAVAQARARLIARLGRLHPRRHRLLWAAARPARRRNRSRHVAGVTARAGSAAAGKRPPTGMTQTLNLRPPWREKP